MCDLSESVIYQEIFEKGYRSGVEKARRQIPLRVMESQLGPLSDEVHQHFDQLILDNPLILALFDAIPNFKSERDAMRWLKQNSKPKPHPEKQLRPTQSASKNGFAPAKKKSN